MSEDRHRAEVEQAEPDPDQYRLCAPAEVNCAPDDTHSQLAALTCRFRVCNASVRRLGGCPFWGSAGWAGRAVIPPGVMLVRCSRGVVAGPGGVSAGFRAWQGTGPETGCCSAACCLCWLLLLVRLWTVAVAGGSGACPGCGPRRGTGLRRRRRRHGS